MLQPNCFRYRINVVFMVWFKYVLWCLYRIRNDRSHASHAVLLLLFKCYAHTDTTQGHYHTFKLQRRYILFTLEWWQFGSSSNSNTTYKRKQKVLNAVLIRVLMQFLYLSLSLCFTWTRLKTKTKATKQQHQQQKHNRNARCTSLQTNSEL